MDPSTNCHHDDGDFSWHYVGPITENVDAFPTIEKSIAVSASNLLILLRSVVVCSISVHERYRG